MPKALPRSRIDALMTMPPERKVRIYSIQDVHAWEAAKARGYWTGSKEYIEDELDREHDCSYLFQYDWMRGKMAERILGYSGDYPMWGYLKRPNLRQVPYVSDDTLFLIADVPRGRMLISDYDFWHMCLFKDYCTWTEEEEQRLEALGLAGKGTPLTPEKIETWDRILDLRERTDPEVVRWRRQPDSLQACVDRIYLDEVVVARPFIGRVGRFCKWKAEMRRRSPAKPATMASLTA